MTDRLQPDQVWKGPAGIDLPRAQDGRPSDAIFDALDAAGLSSDNPIVTSDNVASEAGRNTVTFDENKRAIFTANTPAGGISRLITMQMTTEYDRPAISWLDENGRHRVAFKYHTRDQSSNDYHEALEVKTSADPEGASPGDMRTRMSIGTDAQRTAVGFNYITTMELNQGEHPPATDGTTAAFGLTFRTHPSSGASYKPFQILATVDSSDNTTVNIDAGNAATAKTAQIIINRNLNTSSATGADIYIKKGDGSNTNILALSCRPATPTFTFGDPLNLILGTSTGTKIGTATTQKLGFYNATPVVQRSAITSPSADSASLKTAVDAIRQALIDLGLTA